MWGSIVLHRKKGCRVHVLACHFASVNSATQLVYVVQQFRYGTAALTRFSPAAAPPLPLAAAFLYALQRHCCNKNQTVSWVIVTTTVAKVYHPEGGTATSHCATGICCSYQAHGCWCCCSCQLLLLLIVLLLPVLLPPVHSNSSSCCSSKHARG